MARCKLVQVIELLGQVSFTSHLCEKLHASAATIRKYHRELGTSMLALRSFFHSFRQMLDVDTGLDRKVERTQRQMESLLLKQPQKITARHAFFCDIVDRTRAKNARRSESEAHIHHSAAMRLHGRHFALLSDGERQTCVQKACLKQSAAALHHEEKYSELETQLQSLLAQDGERRKQGSTMLFSNCGLRSAQLKKKGPIFC
eukprot:2085446-Amphidinium_carterae.1